MDKKKEIQKVLPNNFEDNISLVMLIKNTNK